MVKNSEVNFLGIIFSKLVERLKHDTKIIFRKIIIEMSGNKTQKIN